MDLYKADKMEMIREGVLDKTYLALSREPSIPKVGSNSNIDTIVILKYTNDFDRTLLNLYWFTRGSRILHNILRGPVETF